MTYKTGNEMTCEEALRRLDPDKLAFCYLIYGEETFFIHRILHWFFEKGIDKESRDFNINRFEGEKITPEEVLLAAKSYPMGGPKRLVVLEDTEKIKDPQDRFLSYLDSPPSTTVMVFVAKKPDMRTKLFLALKQQATLIHCRPLYENEVPRFIRQEGERLRLRITEDAIWFLKEHLGNNLFLIQQEIEKLSLHLGQGYPDADALRQGGPNQEGLSPATREVSLDRVRAVLSGEGEHSIFELLRALGEKDLRKALFALSFLLVQGEPPLKILTLFAREFRIMASLKEALLVESESVAGKRLSMPPSRIPEFFKRLRLWKKEEIRATFNLLQKADLQLKGGRLAASIVLEKLILELCASSPR